MGTYEALPPSHPFLAAGRVSISAPGTSSEARASGFAARQPQFLAYCGGSALYPAKWAFIFFAGALTFVLYK
jgi:hypothetical protein